MADTPSANDTATSWARLSDCEVYRYALGRRWSNDGEVLAFVMLNPSTADAAIDDPTIRRCIGFAKRDGYQGVVVHNLYGFRATDPKALLRCPDPIGPQNDDYLRLTLTERIRRGLPTIAAWGANAQAWRAEEVLGLVPGVDWRCLGTTKDGHPRHPLYVKGDKTLESFA